MKVMALALEEIDSRGEGVILFVISPFPDISGWQIKKISRPIKSPED
jgi:hypothetical protein